LSVHFPLKYELTREKRFTDFQIYKIFPFTSKNWYTPGDFGIDFKLIFDINIKFIIVLTLFIIMKHMQKTRRVAMFRCSGCGEKKDCICTSKEAALYIGGIVLVCINIGLILKFFGVF